MKDFLPRSDFKDNNFRMRRIFKKIGFAFSTSSAEDIASLNFQRTFFSFHHSISMYTTILSRSWNRNKGLSTLRNGRVCSFKGQDIGTFFVSGE